MPSRRSVSGRRRAAMWCCAAIGAIVGSGCSGDGRSLAQPTRTMPPPIVTATVNSATVNSATVNSATVNSATSAAIASTTLTAPSTVPSNVVIDLLRSPENAIAEITGTGATYADAVTVDGLPADVIAFDIAPDDTFNVRVWIEDEGAHTVCVGGECSRVYTLEPNAQSPAEVIALIEQAMPLAQQIVDYPTLFPDWTVEIGGLLSGTGGTTDAKRKVVTIFRNRNRTVDDFARTIVHELGHVADDEWLDDDERAMYLSIRGIPAGTPWRIEAAVSLDEWQLQPSEDFAEVMALIWSDGQYMPRTDTLAPAPDAAQLAAIAALVEPE